VPGSAAGLYPAGGAGGTANLNPATGVLSFTNDPQPQQVWVSKDALASDSNSGQQFAPFATIAKAISSLGGGAGQINVGVGTFTISTADGSGNAITLANPGIVLAGAGEELTNIHLTGTFTWGIKSTASHCQVQNLSVQLTSGTCTYGVGTSVAPAGSAESCYFINVLVDDSVIGGLTACFAVGPDHAGSSNLDISHNVFINCEALGNGSTTGTGNIVANEVYSSEVFLCVNAIILSGSGIRWFGGSFSTNSGADIKTTGAHGLDPVYFAGLRSDGGNCVYDDSASSDNNAPGGLQLDDCQFFSYNPTLHSSNIINFTSSGICKLMGGCFFTTGEDETFYVVGGSSAAPATFVAIGVCTDNETAWINPVPTQTKRIWIGNVYSTIGTYIPNPNAYNVIDNGTDTAGGAAVSTPTFASGTASQLAQTTTDAMVYLTCTTSGTAFTLKIGPTSTPANTIVPSSAVVAGTMFSVRLPAGWYLEWTATTAAFATQTAITC
jgi:hypothetical protein